MADAAPLAAPVPTESGAGLVAVVADIPRADGRALRVSVQERSGTPFVALRVVSADGSFSAGGGFTLRRRELRALLVALEAADGVVRVHRHEQRAELRERIRVRRGRLVHVVMGGPG